jgi:cell division protein FtsI (penicillin-binding protein 3)
MDPRTGALYGMVSVPDYDPNRYEMVPQENYNLFNNPAITAQYEPGSVYKIITMAAAMDAGRITPDTVMNDSGSYSIGGRVIFNSNRAANGEVTITKALALSLNVITAQVAEELGSDEFYRYVRLFGFGEATNVDLSGEINGIIKTPSDDMWSLADLGTNSFGQGLACTPLQMLNATAVIANGGRLLQPYVVEARVMDGKAQLTEPVVTRQVIKPETSRAMAEMMAEIVTMSSSLAGVEGYAVAGKSGTAQIPSPEGYVSEETIVSFVGFAPADDPKFVMLVKMDRPDPEVNPWAGQTAAPVFGRIAKRLLDYFSVPPDEVRLAAARGAGN